MIRLRLFAALVGCLLVLDCAHGGAGNSKKYITDAARFAALRRANVWTRTDVAAMDLKAGPAGNGAFAPGETVACTYLNEALGGRTPKFACAISAEDHVKVRYGRDNGEVYAGVAATRLLWALGFGADPLYPVHVVCRACPKSIAGDRSPSTPGDTRVDVAAIERKFPGHDIEAVKTGSGWAWPELDLVDEAEGGAPAAERDALKLLAVFLQHSDNKADQQRLVCLDDHDAGHDRANCAKPFMMIHDLGQTFGRSNLFNRASVGSVNLEMWSHTAVWRDANGCVGNLAPSQTGTLADPRISEAGRKFLADLLAQLTDAQLTDLFTVARFADRPQNGAQPSTVEGWVSAFKHKRSEIEGASCRS